MPKRQSLTQANRDPKAELQAAMTQAVASGLIQNQIAAGLRSLESVGMQREELVDCLAEMVCQRVEKTLASDSRTLVRCSSKIVANVTRRCVAAEIEELLS